MALIDMSAIFLEVERCGVLNSGHLYSVAETTV